MSQPSVPRAIADETSAHDELRSWLRVITEIAGAVTLHEPLSVLLNLLARSAGELMGYEFCAVLLADEGRGMLEIRGSHGLTADYESQVRSSLSFRLGPQPAGETPSSRAFVNHQPVAVEDVLIDPAFRPWANLAEEAGFRSLISVPLLVNGRAVGTLNGYRAQPCQFDQDEILLLAALANLAGTAIETARLREREQETIGQLQQLNASLREQTMLLEHAEQIHRRLTTVALESGGLQTVVTVLAGLLSRPVLVEDAGLGVIASAAHEGQTVDAPPSEVRSRQSAAPDQDAKGDLREFAPWPGAQPDQWRTSVPVFLDREMVARFWLPGRPSELSALELRAIEHAVVVSALELLRERTALDVEWTLRGDVLAELLADRPTDSTTVVSRARSLGLDLRAPHSLLVVRADDAPGATDRASSDQRRLLEFVRESARHLKSSSLVTISGNYVVLLLSSPAEEATGHVIPEVADSIRVHCARRLHGATVSVSAGEPCRDVGDYAGAFRMQRGALELARLQGVRDRTVTLPDLGFYGLLLQLDEPSVLSQFAEQTLAPLRRYDEAKHTELVATLRAYFAHNLNTMETAAVLYVHANTVGLRLRRIESLLNLSLAQPESLLRVKAALMTDDVLRLRQPQPGGLSPVGRGPTG
ncbi:MAG: Two component domain sensor and regulator [Nocardioides sp.]|nr:Two component domain sensor and regulator [Nocardioides sp.]